MSHTGWHERHLWSLCIISVPKRPLAHHTPEEQNCILAKVKDNLESRVWHDPYGPQCDAMLGCTSCRTPSHIGSNVLSMLCLSNGMHWQSTASCTLATNQALVGISLTWRAELQLGQGKSRWNAWFREWHRIRSYGRQYNARLGCTSCRTPS